MWPLTLTIEMKSVSGVDLENEMGLRWGGSTYFNYALALLHTITSVRPEMGLEWGGGGGGGGTISIMPWHYCLLSPVYVQKWDWSEGRGVHLFQLCLGTIAYYHQCMSRNGIGVRGGEGGPPISNMPWHYCILSPVYVPHVMYELTS